MQRQPRLLPADQRHRPKLLARDTNEKQTQKRKKKDRRKRTRQQYTKKEKKKKTQADSQCRFTSVRADRHPIQSGRLFNFKAGVPRVASSEQLSLTKTHETVQDVRPPRPTFGALLWVSQNKIPKQKLRQKKASKQMRKPTRNSVKKEKSNRERGSDAAEWPQKQ